MVEIDQDGPDRGSCRSETIEAMRAGRRGDLPGDLPRGRAARPRRLPLPGRSPLRLGDWSYEVADTKLARRAKPYFILQLCFYSELLARAQGAEPELIHVILGTSEQHSFRLAEFAAYYRRVRERLLADLAAGVPDTYPDPVEHCSICDWRTECDQRRLDDDHLSLVAG